MDTTMPNVYQVPAGSLHKTWNRSTPPVLTIKPGDEIALRAPDAANGEISKRSTTTDIAAIDYRRLDPLVGPVYIEGARSGDALEIEVLSLKTLGWGWTALLPDFGLLAHDSQTPYCFATTSRDRSRLKRTISHVRIHDPWFAKACPCIEPPLLLGMRLSPLTIWHELWLCWVDHLLTVVGEGSPGVKRGLTAGLPAANQEGRG